MKASLFLILAAISATIALPSAAPAASLEPVISEDDVEKRATAGTALVQFFYDTKCTYFNSQGEVGGAVKPGSNPQVIGGKYGTRSAWFVSTGGLQNWVIQTNNKDSKGVPTGMAQRPKVAQCIHFDNQGIEAWGTNDASIHL